MRAGKFRCYELCTVQRNLPARTPHPLHVLIERRLLICASYFFLQFGRTPLYAACKGGHKECIRLLLEAGADAKKPTKNGWEPIDMAKVSDFNCFWSFIYITCVHPGGITLSRLCKTKRDSKPTRARCLTASLRAAERALSTVSFGRAISVLNYNIIPILISSPSLAPPPPPTK